MVLGNQNAPLEEKKEKQKEPMIMLPLWLPATALITLIVHCDPFCHAPSVCFYSLNL